MKTRLLRFVYIFSLSFFVMGCAINTGGAGADKKEMMIYGRPSNTSYVVGESLSLEGLKVIDVDSGAQITDYTTNPSVGYVFVEADIGSMDVIISKSSYKSISFTVYIDENVNADKKVIDIYTTNDMHGQVEYQTSSGTRASLGTVMTYLKNKKDNNPNALLLDQGDTWQGSIYSNYNHGEMITDVMNYVHYDARTVGNHDFDWSITYLEQNSAKEYEGYKTPVLAGNIYDYNFATKTVGSVQQSSIGVPSVTYTLENGVKVGIIGTIGKNQITSINSLFTHDIAFIDHIAVIKSEAYRLRNQGCNIVISCCHAGQEDMLGNSLGNYVDLVLCAHTHKREQTFENGVLFAQYGSYNQYVGHIQLLYDEISNKVTYGEIDAIEASEMMEKTPVVDTTIQSIINNYCDECDLAANEVVASNVRGSFYSRDNLPNLMCKAIYEEAVKEGYDDLTLAYCNEARASLYNSTWKYSDLYQAFPFDNTIYIIEISYDEMVREVGSYNNVYRSPNFNGVLDSNKTYKIACIDYLAFHTNASRYYDYFSDNNGQYLGTLSNNYRIILKNYLEDNGYKTGALLNSSDYATSLTQFSRNFTY